MDLVDEQYFARAELAQQRHEIGSPWMTGLPSRAVDANSGNDLRERGLSKPGGPTNRI